ncbi:hypothetical protein N9L26_02050 [Candidatus Pacebacteria bacterium]|nr:hypothetical protein [Candidatus Paceibacterota bacterium]
MKYLLALSILIAGTQQTTAVELQNWPACLGHDQIQKLKRMWHHSSSATIRFLKEERGNSDTLAAHCWVLSEVAIDVNQRGVQASDIIPIQFEVAGTTYRGFTFSPFVRNGKAMPINFE